jgi:hypothetical protein
MAAHYGTAMLPKRPRRPAHRQQHQGEPRAASFPFQSLTSKGAAFPVIAK